MFSFRGLRLLAIVLAPMLVGLSLSCGLDSGERIAFVSSIGGDEEVVLLDPDSREITVLTENGGQDFSPRWSPDGEVIAYISSDGGNNEVRLADPQEDIIITRLTSAIGDDQSLDWSPDGRRLAFISERDGNPELYLMNADGSNQNRLTSTSAQERLGDWSPNGIWLVFSRSGAESEDGLWLRNPDGVNLIQLTQGQDSDPAWSADGQHVAFVRSDRGNSDIYIASRLTGGTWQDATELTRLTQHQSEDLAPAWSLESQILVFVSYRDGNAEIYTTWKDGSNQRRLTSNEADDLDPVWSPGGGRIAFVSHLYGPGEIFVMNADGRNQLRLTNNGVEDRSPDW